MNNTFLEYVALDLIQKYGNDFSRTAIVFPNKRASLFLNEYLIHLSDGPLWSPSYITISDLFRQHSQLVIADELKLVCDLYHTFAECTNTNETLDQFYNWGQLLLADFDDVDKNMINAHELFMNLKNYHELDNISYLTSQQIASLKFFFSNFHEGQETELKKRFLNLWCHLYDIYTKFKEKLYRQGFAYEGMLYRDVVKDENVQFEYDMYAFVGFNALHKVEKTLFEKLKSANKAIFYWDFDQYYIKPYHEAGHYIRQYLQSFPNELNNSEPQIYSQLNQKKDITFIAASTETIQARYISTWLRENGRIAAGRKTAIILCDETLLPTVIHSLPNEVENVNITTGFPLSQTPIFSLVTILFHLQAIGSLKHREKLQAKHIKEVLRHPYAKFLSKDISRFPSLFEQEPFPVFLSDILSKDEQLSVLSLDIRSLDGPQDINTLEWLLTILRQIGMNARDCKELMVQESVFYMYSLLKRTHAIIQECSMNMGIHTLQRLITQMVQSCRIPFQGEPVVGIQIMGVLETRNLDFDHLLILSCNEGNLPKNQNSASFIPYSVRKAYGLTTTDRQAAVYAYHFFRLLQRGKDISLAFNHATQDGHMHEKSRFMLQLMTENQNRISFKNLQSYQIPTQIRRKPIRKLPYIMEILENIDSLSPTAINRYLRCQLQFYYHTILNIKELDELDEEDISSRAFGNIFHRAAELTYQKILRFSSVVRHEHLQSYIDDYSFIASAVDQAFQEERMKISPNKKHSEYSGLQLINREVIVTYIRQLLKIDQHLTPFTIIGLEKKIQTSILIPGRSDSKYLKIEGYIDRLDRIIMQNGEEKIRVIDYKTGKVPTSKVNSIDEIFTGENIERKHTDYYLQAMLYSLIIRGDHLIGENMPVSPALLFIQQTHETSYDPTLTLGKDKIQDIQFFSEDFFQRLKELIGEIFNVQSDFIPTSVRERCLQCPYRHICG